MKDHTKAWLLFVITAFMPVGFVILFDLPPPLEWVLPKTLADKMDEGLAYFIFAGWDEPVICKINNAFRYTMRFIMSFILPEDENDSFFKGKIKTAIIDNADKILDVGEVIDKIEDVYSKFRKGDSEFTRRVKTAFGELKQAVRDVNFEKRDGKDQHNCAEDDLYSEFILKYFQEKGVKEMFIKKFQENGIPTNLNIKEILDNHKKRKEEGEYDGNILWSDHQYNILWPDHQYNLLRMPWARSPPYQFKDFVSEEENDKNTLN